MRQITRGMIPTTIIITHLYSYLMVPQIKTASGPGQINSIHYLGGYLTMRCFIKYFSHIILYIARRFVFVMIRPQRYIVFNTFKYRSRKIRNQNLIIIALGYQHRHSADCETVMISSKIIRLSKIWHKIVVDQTILCKIPAEMCRDLTALRELTHHLS